MSLKCTMILGDCLDVIPTLPKESVDFLCADMPYGLINQKWDNRLRPDVFWSRVGMVNKPCSTTCCMASHPLTTELIVGNPKNFRYEMIWIKSRASNFFQAKTRPLRAHENILVFASPKHTFNPQMTVGKSAVVRQKSTCVSGNYGITHRAGVVTGRQDGLRYPTSALFFSSGRPQNSLHPTQKPLALLDWLIRTYSNAANTVLDPTSGSGTTAVASMLLGRSSICIEKDQGYFDASVDRVMQTAKRNLIDVKIEVIT